jgi:hypothetical protein
MLFSASTFLFLMLLFGFQKDVNTFIMYPSGIAKKKLPIENRIQGWAEERAEMTKNIISGKVEFEDRFKVLNQINDISKLNTRGADIAWESRGPNNVGGRTCGFVFDNQNPQRCYAGGVSGGVFVSDNLGLNWRRAKFENNEILAVSVGSMKQSINGDVYVGTGEYWGNTPDGAFGSQFYGNGIYKLTAGEDIFKILPATRTASWTVGTNPAPQFRMVLDIATHPTDNNKVYAATDNGLMISSDAGVTWKKAGGQASVGVVAQIKIAPNGTDLFIGSNGRFWKSTNDGSTWTQVATSYFAEGFNQHVRIAISSLDDNGNYFVYASGITSTYDLKFLIKSEDKGATWQMLGKAEGIIQPMCSQQGTTSICQGFYDMCLAVNPKNNDQVYLGGMQSLYTWSKSNGWIKCAFWSAPSQVGVNQVHSDMHEFAFHKNSDTMVVCTDGGLFMSYNASSKFPLPTWAARNLNYNVTQFYDVQASIYGEIIGGAQDNGTQFVSANGSSSWDAFQVNGGDGFDCGLSRNNDSKVHFYTIYNGSIKRTTNMGASATDIVSGTCADGGSGVSGVGFHTRIHHVESSVYYTDDNGVQHDSVDWGTLMAFDENGGVFVSPTAHQPNSKIVWTQRNAWGAGKIYCAAHSKNADIVYLGGVGGVKKITGYRSAKFTDISSGNTPNCVRVTLQSQPVSMSGTSGTIGGLYVDRNDAKKVVATQIGFGGTTKVFYSSDGATFTNKNGNLPSFPVYSCVIDEMDAKHVLVGTEYGVWETDDITVASPVWREQNIGIGRVPVMRMRQVSVIDTTTGRAEGCPVIYLGTHGNGFYRTILHSYDNCNYKAGRITKSTSGLNPIANVATKFTLFPNPATSSDKLNVQFNSKSVKEYEISIYDANARLVKKEQFRSTVGKNVHQTDISAFIDGIYFVRIEDENSVVAGDRLVISNK